MMKNISYDRCVNESVDIKAYLRLYISKFDEKWNPGTNGIKYLLSETTVSLISVFSASIFFNWRVVPCNYA